MNDSIPRGFAEEIGVEWVDLGAETATARIVIDKRHLQPYGIVHGGVFSSLAESLTSAATYTSVKDEGKVAMGQANDTSFLRPATEGTITATATRRHGGSTTWVWDVDMTDDQGRVCAMSRMTIAVRPARRD